MSVKVLFQLIITTALAALLAACQLQGSNTGKQTSANTGVMTENIPTLEVIGVFGEGDGDSVELMSLDHKMRYRTIVSIANLGDDYVSLKVGERVQIAGEYAESYPVQIFSIQKITKVANPEKQACEASKGNHWRPQGKAQIPACVRTYADAGKPCTASSQCEGDCIVTHPKALAVCAKSSSRFGCRSSIEDFQKHGGILCVD